MMAVFPSLRITVAITADTISRSRPNATAARIFRPIYNRSMADALYLSVWFPSFRESEMMPRLLSVLRQFPFSTSRPGIGYLGVHAVSWNEPVIFSQTFDYRADPERVVALAAEFLHDDYAYEVEALWDLWSPRVENVEDPFDVPWILQPQPVRFAVYGT